MRTYHLEDTRLRLFYLVAAVVGGFGLVLGALFFWVVAQLGLDLIGLLVAALPVVLLGGLALAIIYYARSTRLELADRGVALRLPGGYIESDWADIERVEPAAFGPLTGDALVLHRPARMRWAWWLALLGAPRDVSVIPIGPFALPLRGSRLEADLRHRIPALFES